MKSAVVVGAGIGGLTAALALARRGIDVQVHERAAAFGEVGAGLQIGPNGVHVLRALGLEAGLMARASQPQAVDMRDGLSGRRIASVPMRDALDRYGAPYVQIHRADLLDLLADAARASGVRVHFNSCVAPDNPPKADVLVAADGIRSTFRAALVPGIAPAFTGQVAWRALVPAGLVPEVLDPRRTALFMGPGRHVVAYTLRDSSVWNLVAVEERADWTAEGWNEPANPEDMRAGFAGWCAPVSRLLDAVDEGHRWGLFGHGMLPRWHDDRTALLGDACHPMLPFLAQGATMAVEDAWVLAECLATSDDVPRALAWYETARKGRTTRVQGAAARNAAIYHMAPGPARAVLRTGMKAVGALAPGGLLARFDWLYGRNVTRGEG